MGVKYGCRRCGHGDLRVANCAGGPVVICNTCDHDENKEDWERPRPIEDALRAQIAELVEAGDALAAMARYVATGSNIHKIHAWSKAKEATDIPPCAGCAEKSTVLRAWWEAFGTTQLTHAKARLEAAESTDCAGCAERDQEMRDIMYCIQQVQNPCAPGDDKKAWARLDAYLRGSTEEGGG